MLPGTTPPATCNLGTPPLGNCETHESSPHSKDAIVTRTSPSTQAFDVYDTTLRDGAQQEGMNLSVADKMAIAPLLDELGVGFIEGGWPGAIPKDTEFFKRAAKDLRLRHAQLAAFGATRKPDTRASADPQVRALLDADAPVVTLVAKSDVRHVERALRTTPAENLAMIADTVTFLVGEGRRVVLDAEHFFDGYRFDPAYAVEAVRTAFAAGAEVATLCDTNGGMLPDGVAEIVAAVRVAVGPEGRLGVHAHNDSGCAVANSLAAVAAGAEHVQGDGQRLRRADRATPTSSPSSPTSSSSTAGACSPGTACGTRPASPTRSARSPTSAPSRGSRTSAPARSRTRPACTPRRSRSTPTSTSTSTRPSSATTCGCSSPTWPAGRRSSSRAASSGSRSRASPTCSAGSPHGSRTPRPRATRSTPPTRRSSCCCARRSTASAWRTSTSRAGGPSSRRCPAAPHDANAEATVKLIAGGRRVVATGEGNGPVNALDHALRQALVGCYPEIERFELIDFKVRIMDAAHGTDAVTRVLVETMDVGAETTWRTVGVGPNVIEASWEALVDSIVYGLLKAGVERTT